MVAKVTVTHYIPSYEKTSPVPTMPINRKEVRLRPLPLRVTPRQFECLVALRSHDSLSIQEHVRRAIDAYLANTQAPPPLHSAQMHDAISPGQVHQPLPPVAPPGRQRVSSKPYGLR